MFAVALALALALCAAQPPAAAGQHCAALHQDHRNRSGRYVIPRTRPVLLAWGASPARAAAALLRAALLAAGRAPAHVSLLHLPGSVCSLLALSDNLTQGEARAALVVVGAAWSPADPCEWGARALRPHGPGAAPAAPRLHVRLAAPHASPACAATDSWHFYRDSRALSDCGFLPPGSEGSKNATVYVIEGEWEDASAALRPMLRGLRLQVEAAARAQLAQLVRAAPHSFLFLDAELWAAEARVRPGPAPPAPALSLRLVDEYAMHTQAPELYGTLRRFQPSGRDLRRVLDRTPSLSFEEAACDLVASSLKPAGFTNWTEAAMTSVLHRLTAFLCLSESNDFLAYKESLKYTGEEIFRSTNTIGLVIELKLEAIDCGDPRWLLKKLLEWNYRGELAVTIGVVVPAEAASTTMVYAADMQLPLVAYEAAEPSVPSAGGSLNRLAVSLRRLLAACRWRRVGVLSDGSARAALLLRMVRGAGDELVVREENATTAAEAGRALAELAAADARVFLVNTGAAMAAHALAAAVGLGLAGRGRAFIVREYAAGDAASAALRPLSLSHAWRGARPDSRPAPLPRTRLHSQLEEKWGARTWPRHAMPIVDAFLTIAEGYKHLVIQHHEMRDYPPKNNKLRLFWESVRATKIGGVIEELKYDALGVKQTQVFVEQWDGQARPLVLLAWRAGEPGQPGEACPASSPPADGSGRCAAPAGDPFQPRCLDGVWAGAAAALLLAAAALAAAARAFRRAVARRDSRLRVEVYSRLLARREQAFAALAAHLVDRSLLELREELGAGSFGRVRLAVLRPARGRPRPLAAKALREDAAPAEEAQFLREACTLAALEHEHIVRFAGVCIADGPPLLLMEHAFFGDLLRYLRARRHLAEGAEEARHVSAAALTRLAREAASALAYLARRGLVHRDVRAANCLVDAQRALKLADFGLARHTGAADGEYACRGRALFPVLWMAPESLARGVASAASDAWALGVLALELVTLGARPWGAASPASAVRAVLAGGRPPLPRDASPETRALALACWRRRPERRPTAARVAAWLAARPAALRPALAAPCDDVDCDSGLGEPLLDPRSPDSDSPDIHCGYG